MRRKLAKFETSHIDQVILLNQAGKNTHEHICESLELFAKEVMPEFQGHHAEHEAWKRKVMARRDRARGDRHGGVPRPLRQRHAGAGKDGGGGARA